MEQRLLQLQAELQKALCCAEDSSTYFWKGLTAICMFYFIYGKLQMHKKKVPHIIHIASKWSIVGNLVSSTQ
jgi:hypothetical protein